MQKLSELLSKKKIVTIGSDSENDLVLADPTVDAQHCFITKLEEGKYQIEDLNSVSGTFVNNHRITKETITGDDFIKIGEQILQIGTPVSATNNIADAPKTEAPKTEAPKAEPESPKNSHVIKVYFLAAPEDEEVCKAIDKHINAIRQNSKTPIEVLGDFKIPAGADRAAYKNQLYESNIVLAFISVDFINNNDCYSRNQKVIERYNRHETILLPILVRNCMWKATPFASLPLLPKNQQPLNNKQFWNSQDDALMAVVNDIYDAINGVSGSGTAEPSKPKNSIPLDINWRSNYTMTTVWKRFLASIIDFVVIGLPLTLVVVALFGLDETGNIDPMCALIIYIVQIFIFAKMETSEWRGTPGKRYLKLEITDDEGHTISFSKSLVRNFIKLFLGAISVNPFLALVYIVSQILVFSNKKKFIHDLLSKTVIGERVV